MACTSCGMYMRGGQRVGQVRREAAPAAIRCRAVMGSPFATLTKNALQCYNILIYNIIFIYPFLHTKAEAL
jgi:uncharacterized membrane protein